MHTLSNLLSCLKNAQKAKKSVILFPQPSNLCFVGICVEFDGMKGIFADFPEIKRET